MKQLRMVRHATIVVAAMLVHTGAAGQLLGKALHVANHGVDSAVCGDEGSPCRSIRQAIANASAGDLIVVGPGRYGDLNGNGIFGEPGEEGGAAAWNCMILVDKPVTLISREGASSTVLDATGAPNVTVVRILAHDVVFGGFNRGFTLRGGMNSLVVQGVSGVVVQGNRATGSGRDGFLIYGSGNKVRHNQAFGNVQVGFFVTGHGHEVVDNEAVSNGTGFWIHQSGHAVRRNLALDNGSAGFLVEGERHSFTRNDIVGNRGVGIMANSSSSTFKKNNIYGNAGVVYNHDVANCGFLNNTAGTIIATENFWGAESGPGWDPADDVCGFAGGRTIVEPFAVSEYGPRAVPLPVPAPADRIPTTSDPQAHP